MLDQFEDEMLFSIDVLRIFRVLLFLLFFVEQIKKATAMPFVSNARQ